MRLPDTDKNAMLLALLNAVQELAEERHTQDAGGFPQPGSKIDEAYRLGIKVASERIQRTISMALDARKARLQARRAARYSTTHAQGGRDLSRGAS